MKNPMDLIQSVLEEKILIRLRDGQILKGRLYGVDEHLNIMVETEKDLLFIRGDYVTLIGQE